MKQYFKKLILFYQRTIEGQNLATHIKSTVVNNDLEHMSVLIEQYPHYFSLYNQKKDSTIFAEILSHMSTFDMIHLLITSHLEKKIDLKLNSIKNNNVLNFFVNSIFPKDSEKTIELLLTLPEIRQMVGRTLYHGILNPSVYEYAIQGQKTMPVIEALLAVDDKTFFNNLNVCKQAISHYRNDILELMVKKTPQFIEQHKEELFLYTTKNGNTQSLKLLIQIFEPSIAMLEEGQSNLIRRHRDEEMIEFFTKELEKAHIKKEMKQIENQLNRTTINSCKNKHKTNKI